MSGKMKAAISKRGVNVDEWRNCTGQPPLNQPEQKIFGTITFPKFDSALLKKYIKENGCKF